MAEEVKIVVRAESQGNGLRETEQQLDRIEAAGKRASRTTSEKTKGINVTPPDMSDAGLQKALPKDASRTRRTKQLNSAKTARLEKDLATAQANGNPEEVAQATRALREQKLAARIMREQGVGAQEAHRQASALVEAQTAAKARGEAEKVAGKTRTAEEKAAAKARLDALKQETHETKEQEMVRNRITRSTMLLGREVMAGGSLAGGLGSMATAAGLIGAPVMAAVGGGMLVQELTKDYMERQGIANRDRASRATDQRNLGIRSGWRGTASGAQAAQFATEDEIFAREQERQEILQRNKRAWYNPLRLFGETTWAGERERDENEKNIARLKERRAAEEAQTRQKFETEEGALELDAIRQRSKRTMNGIRAAQVDDAQISYVKKYREFRGKGATDSEADEGARLSVENELRDKQIRAASGLVDARAGASDIAAAARWSQQAVPGWGQVKDGIDALHSTIKNSYDKSAEIATRDTTFGK